MFVEILSTRLHLQYQISNKTTCLVHFESFLNPLYYLQIEFKLKQQNLLNVFVYLKLDIINIIKI